MSMWNKTPRTKTSRPTAHVNVRKMLQNMNVGQQSTEVKKYIAKLETSKTIGQHKTIARNNV